MFKNELVLEHIPDRALWKVDQPFTYVSERYGVTINVPVGFTTDLASVPRFAWWLIPTDDRHIVDPAVIHDYLYRMNGLTSTTRLTRAECDRVLSDAIIERKGPWWYRHVVYWCVRLGGGKAWDSYEKKNPY